jgi:hypothetical protein
VTNNQTSCQKAKAQHQEPLLLLLGVIRIVNQSGAIIQKNTLGFLKRDPMLRHVGPSLALIPGKFNIAHSIILALR